EQGTENQDKLYWNKTIQTLVIRRLLEGIRSAAENAYQDDRTLNTLVLIDEAHRLAQRERSDNEEEEAIRSVLIDAARTTRKYGVGWMFISQTLSSLHREIVEQLRIFFFGFGLGMGTEFRSLSELVGGRSNAIDLYRLFRDPHSSFDVESREYSFMTTGPVSPLSFAGTPLFFNVFNDVAEFLGANDLKPNPSN
ncbi:MAG: ATP-binding protein, partial [Chloroflexi bacterium]